MSAPDRQAPWPSLLVQLGHHSCQWCADMLDPRLTQCRVLLCRLQAFADQGSTNLVLLTSQQLVKLRFLLFPQQWRGDGPVKWTPGQDGQPSEAFLGLLWQKLQVCWPGCFLEHCTS